MSVSHEYLAGLFDGEGCIHIQPQAPSGSYGCRISIEMTDKPMIKMLHRLYPGYYNERIRGDRKPLYIWRLSEEQACRRFLADVLPHLRVKDREAHALLRFMDERATMPRTRGRTNANRRRLEVLRLQLRAR